MANPKRLNDVPIVLALPVITGGIPYLLREDFTDTRAAGSVNGTPATPGPGARVVTDTANKLSLAGGYCVVDKKTTPSYGDPGLWNNYAVTRVPGQLFTAHFYLTTLGLFLLGLDSNTSGTVPIEHNIMVGPATLAVYDWYSSPQIFGVLTAGYDYYLTIALRSRGAHYFLRGGPEFPAQTLLFSVSGATFGSNDTPLYAMICNNAAVGKVGYLRFPKRLWLPSPLASDAFTRASLASTDGLGHQETSGLGSGGSGLAWTSKQGTFGITANAAKASALDGSGVAIATVDTGKADVNIDAVISSTAGISGIVLRYVDSDNYIYAGWDGTNWIAVKRVASVETTVLTAAAALGAGAIKVHLHGDRIYLIRNWVTNVGAEGIIGDAILQTSTLHGLFSTDLANTIDTLAIWSRT